MGDQGIDTGALDRRSDDQKQLTSADEQDENDDELPVPCSKPKA